MKRRRIKWVNVMIAVAFVLSSLYIISTLFILATSIASLTCFGIVTTVLALMIAGMSMDYLIDEM